MRNVIKDTTNPFLFNPTPFSTSELITVCYIKIKDEVLCTDRVRSSSTLGVVEVQPWSEYPSKVDFVMSVRVPCLFSLIYLFEYRPLYNKD